MIMRKLLILLNLITLAALVSCQKDPEDYPLDRLTKDYVFDANDPNGTLALEYLVGIYSYIPKGFNRVADEFLDVATDDAIPSRDVNGGIELLRTLRMNSNSANPDGFWTTGFTGIRKANVFLANIDVVPFNVDGTPNITNYLKAEARFLRAYFYFELLKRYGGVPLIGDHVFDFQEDMNLSRSSFEEVVNYIVSECDAIVSEARPDNTNTTNDINWGRATKGVIMTLKAKVLNYAASPLYNGGNIALGDPVLEKLQGYSTYDKDRWAQAAQAAKDVMDLNIYSLSPILNLFIQRKNPEMIFAILRPTTRDIMQLNGPIGFYETNTRGEGLVSPTQELVDAFPMSNGLAIDASSTYDNNDPYVNRDGRLQRSVFLNNFSWLRRPLEMYEGGLDKPNIQGRTQTRTGYYSKKYLHFNFKDSYEYSLQSVNFQIFRYADVLLMRAEALNESNDVPPAEVYDLLKQIRVRAGIVGGANYGIPIAMTQDEARDFIQNEKRLEFFMEEHRYWDVRRWKLAEDLFDRKLHGMKILKNGSVFTYERIPVADISFRQRMYFYPIPANEVLNNPNMVQNKGW